MITLISSKKLGVYKNTRNTVHTSQNSFNKWSKILSLEVTIFDLKMIVKSGLDFFIFFSEPLQRQMLSCQAKSALLRQIFLHWAATTLKGLTEFKVKNSRSYFTIIFKSKMSISRIEILVHLQNEFQLVCVVRNFETFRYVSLLRNHPSAKDWVGLKNCQVCYSFHTVFMLI